MHQVRCSPMSQPYAGPGALLLLSAVLSACVAQPVQLTKDPTPAQLRVLRAPSLDEVQSVSPPALQRQHVEGSALILLSIDAAGRVIDATVLNETPSGIGVGAAAQSLAHRFSFTNRLHRPVVITLPVRFALMPPFPPGPPAYSIPPIPGCTGFVCRLSER